MDYLSEGISTNFLWDPLVKKCTAKQYKKNILTYWQNQL